MTRYELYGEDVFAHIAALPAYEQAQIYDDLEKLESDPENKRGDPDSTIQAYKDPERGHTYSIAVAEGRFLIVYTVMQDYPRVWLRVLIDPESNEASLGPPSCACG